MAWREAVVVAGARFELEMRCVAWIAFMSRSLSGGSSFRRRARRKGLHFGCVQRYPYDWLGIESIAASRHVAICFCVPVLLKWTTLASYHQKWLMKTTVKPTILYTMKAGLSPLSANRQGYRDRTGYKHQKARRLALLAGRVRVAGYENPLYNF